MCVCVYLYERVRVLDRGMETDKQKRDVPFSPPEPGPPSAMSTIPGDSFIKVSLQFPVAPGGLLLNFSISLGDRQHACWDKIPRESTGSVVCKV